MVNIKLNQLLKKYRISQQELSRDTGIRQATISAYVNNTCKHIVIEHINILCSYFNCELLDLIEFKNPPLNLNKYAYFLKD